MAHALVLICSPNGATSVSRNMLDNYLARRKAKFPDETLTVRDLTLPENALPHLSADFTTAMFLPLEARTAEQASPVLDLGAFPFARQRHARAFAAGRSNASSLREDPSS